MTLRGLLLLALAVLGGCASAPRPLYHWDGYNVAVYDALRGDRRPVGEQISRLREQVERARLHGEALPPGLRAHLGLLLLRQGDAASAESAFEAEKAAFPESAAYMDFVLRSLRDAPP